MASSQPAPALPAKPPLVLPERAAVAALALVLLATVALLAKQIALARVPSDDAAGFYLPLARAAAEGEAAAGTSPTIPPLYPLAVGILGRALPEGESDRYVLAGRLLSAAAALGLVACVYALGAATAGRRAAVAAAVLGGTNPWVARFGASVGPDMLYALAVTGAVLALVRYRARPRAAGALWIALLVGVAPLVRSEGLILLPLAAAGMLIRRPRPRARVAAHLALAACVIAAVWLPRLIDVRRHTGYAVLDIRLLRLLPDRGPGPAECSFRDVRLIQPPGPPGDASAAPAEHAVRFQADRLGKYAAGQVDRGEAFVEDGGRTLRLRGSLWRQVPLATRIEPGTVLEFDFRAAREGDVQGVGLDADDYLSPAATFRLAGSQRWGLSDFADYDTPGRWKRYRIPVGRYDIGERDRIFFVNDADLSARLAPHRRWWQTLTQVNAPERLAEPRPLAGRLQEAGESLIGVFGPATCVLALAWLCLRRRPGGPGGTQLLLAAMIAAELLAVARVKMDRRYVLAVTGLAQVFGGLGAVALAEAARRSAGRIGALGRSLKVQLAGLALLGGAMAAMSLLGSNVDTRHAELRPIAIEALRTYGPGRVFVATSPRVAYYARGLYAAPPEPAPGNAGLSRRELELFCRETGAELIVLTRESGEDAGRPWSAWLDAEVAAGRAPVAATARDDGETAYLIEVGELFGGPAPGASGSVD